MPLNAAQRLQQAILRWYPEHARDLPWRRPDASPWSVLVSEFMLQQTPVARVLPAHEAWLRRWPTPADLAASSPGDAIRQWGRLGYPRRAVRLHACARIISAEHDGEVPDRLDALLALPGVGQYTAAAVASFAFGQRHPVLDTNVRRVLARLLAGRAFPPRAGSAAEVALARSLLPAEPRLAARWSVAVMELGALVCTAARPGCERCPVARHCSWHGAGHPLGPPGAGADGVGLRPTPPRQRYEGTDRQCRGALLAVLRSTSGTVSAADLEAAWPDPDQGRRALQSLLADGLAAEPLPGRFALPG